MAISRRKQSSDPSSPDIERLVDVLGEWEYSPNSDEPPGALYWLQAWYAVQCNDEWEHGYGVSIETLDNPGWSVKIELRGTALEGHSYDGVNIERGDHDWVRTWLAQGSFHAACGPLNLGEALNAFRLWVQEPSGA